MTIVIVITDKLMVETRHVLSATRDNQTKNVATINNVRTSHQRNPLKILKSQNNPHITKKVMIAGTIKLKNGTPKIELKNIWITVYPIAKSSSFS